MNKVIYGVGYNNSIRRLGSADGTALPGSLGGTTHIISSSGKTTLACADKMASGNLILNNAVALNCANKMLASNIDIYTAIVSADGYDIITSSGTWVCPIGVTSVSVFCVGAGGGSGGGNCGYIYGNGGGGGAGGYVTTKGYYTNASQAAYIIPGDSYIVTIGAGGAGGLALVYPSSLRTEAQRGGTGGTTSFFGAGVDGTCFATGGGGGWLSYKNDGGGSGGTGGGQGFYAEVDEGSETDWAPGFGGTNGSRGQGANRSGGTYEKSGYGIGDQLSKENSYTGTIIRYCGGGGGGSRSDGAIGGYGGGGRGGDGHAYFPQPGVANTGGGSGGGGSSSNTQDERFCNGETGGSGVIVITWTF